MSTEKNKREGSNFFDVIIAFFRATPALAIAATVIIIVLVLAGGVSWFTSLFSGKPMTAQIDLSDTIISTLSARSQLLTAEEVIRDLPVRVNIRGGIANVLGYGATYETDIVVKAGFNFIREDSKAARIGENNYQITMPKAELLSCSMSPVEEKDRSTSLTADWVSAKQLGEFMLMQQAVREAIDNQDLFASAKANARATINDLLKPINPDIKLTFEFLDGETTFVDDTCQIREPLLWEFNSEENQWDKK